MMVKIMDEDDSDDCDDNMVDITVHYVQGPV
jgi:hypothetical protein